MFARMKPDLDVRKISALDRLMGFAESKTWNLPAVGSEATPVAFRTLIVALRRESKVPSEAATVSACVPASLVLGAKCRLPVVGPVVVTEAKLGPLSREKLSGVASGSDAVSARSFTPPKAMTW